MAREGARKRKGSVNVSLKRFGVQPSEIERECVFVISSLINLPMELLNLRF